VRHHRSVAYSAEKVLLNKHQIYGGAPNYTDTEVEAEDGPY